MRALGVDYGKSRTGLALSDIMGVTCRPLGVLSEKVTDRLVEAIVKVASAEQVGRIVVGLPRPLGGGTNEQMQQVLEFVATLRSASSAPVETWDERFTTTLAERGPKSAAPRDAVAACYMLQNYLDRVKTELGK